MTDWEAELRKRYDHRDKMFHDIGLLLEDSEMLYLIGDKTFPEFDREVLSVALGCFTPDCRKELWTCRGYKISLIRYYCDMFNIKKNPAND